MGDVNTAIRSQARSAMKKKGMTQQAVADALGVDRVYINRMLSGSTSQVPQRWAELLELLKLDLTLKEREAEN